MSRFVTGICLWLALPLVAAANGPDALRVTRMIDALRSYGIDDAQDLLSADSRDLLQTIASLALHRGCRYRGRFRRHATTAATSAGAN
ncbi:MAG: hypothetical protein R3F18_02305 [Lysobacterales bacterium]